MVSFPVDKDPKENAKSTLQSDPREVLLVMTKYLSGNHVLGHGESTGRDPSETLPRGSLQASAAKAHRGRRAGAFLALLTRASRVYHAPTVSLRVTITEKSMIIVTNQGWVSTKKRWGVVLNHARKAGVTAQWMFGLSSLDFRFSGTSMWPQG